MLFMDFCCFPLSKPVRGLPRKASLLLSSVQAAMVEDQIIQMVGLLQSKRKYYSRDGPMISTSGKSTYAEVHEFDNSKAMKLT